MTPRRAVLALTWVVIGAVLTLVIQAVRHDAAVRDVIFETSIEAQAAWGGAK